MKQTAAIIMVITSLTGCADSDKLLVGNDFENGDWLLVNVNYAQNTLQIIDDEVILRSNTNGIWVTPLGDCGGTTCDGFLMLYKDGKLIAEDEYLTRSELYESSEIKAAYKNGKEWTINPSNEVEFKHLWDSLKNAGSYPTIHHTQPEDKDIIEAYRID